jgi:hypothetical protein
MNWFLSRLLLFVSFIGFGQAPTPTNNGIVVESNRVIVLDSFVVTPSSLDAQPIIKAEFSSKKKETNLQKKEQFAAQVSFYNTQFSQTFQAVKTATTQRGPTTAQLQKMKAARDFFIQNVPTSFESYFYQYVLDPFDPHSFSLLKEAAKLNPTHEDVRNYLFSHFYLHQQWNNADSLVGEMVNDQSIKPFQLNYARDLLASCGSGTLIVHGFSDFLPVYYVKQQTGNRTNLINLWLLQAENYRKAMNTQQYIPNQEVVNTTFFEHYIAENRSRPYNISLTVPKAYYEKYSSDFVVSGLTLQFTNFIQNDLEIPINIAGINEQLFDSELKNITDQDLNNPLLMNYIPFLVTLKNRFGLTQQTDNYQKAQEYILQIGTKTNALEQLKPYLD